MNSRNILKTLYHYTFGCCCGSRQQLDDHEDERRQLLADAADYDLKCSLEYQAVLNRRIWIRVPKGKKLEDSEHKDTDAGGNEDKSNESKGDDLTNNNPVDANPEVQVKPEAQALPILVPYPDLKLKIDDPTRKIENNDFLPGPKFEAEKEGKMIQERFAVSKLEFGKGGSFGKVFRARAKANPQVKFAIKVVKKDSLVDERSTDFYDPWYDETANELNVLLQVKHENIVQLLDYFWIKRWNYTDPLCLVLKTENLDIDLEDVLLKVDAPLPLQVTIIVAKQVGKALNYLHHERKIVNHDVKAQNVMMIPFKSLEPKEKLAEYLSSCVIKMIDFGFGKQYSGEVRDCKDSTSTHIRKGTEMYKSLEKIINELYSPFSADCFAFAILLLETMMGYKEFERQYYEERGQIWDKEDKLIKTPFNFILKIAKRFFANLEELTEMHQLVLDLLANEPKRWFMDEAMKVIDTL